LIQKSTGVPGCGNLIFPILFRRNHRPIGTL
jgi:hypothetical protein